MWWLVGVIVVLVIMVTYVTWIMARLDRLHHRAAAAYAALDAQLSRRAAAALLLSEVDDSLGGRAASLREVAADALRAGSEGREVTENQLTRLLRELSLPDRIPAAHVSSPRYVRPLAPACDSQPVDRVEAAITEVIDASRRVALARHVHSDLVRDTLFVRRHPVVRILRLDRRHPCPSYFDIEDPVLDASVR